ncbi:MAG: ABC transporter permease [Chloroherpetonaceae bacterium]|nr:ABC transporter permease [Chloroherpetonaceae bacterium]
MWNRIYAIARKEFYQIRRDKRSLGLLIFVPVFMMFVFGFAISLDITGIQIAFVDFDQSPRSRALKQAFLNDPHFISAGGRNGEFSNEVEAGNLLETARANMVIIIPPRFSARLDAGETIAVQALVSGDNANTASGALGYAAQFVQSFSSSVQLEQLARYGQNSPTVIDYRPRYWFNPELKSSKYLIPGLMGFVLIVSTVLSTALSIVREKELGTIEQIMVSPVQSREFILGKIIPYFFIGCGLAAFVVVTGWIVFDVPLSGNLVMLTLSLLLFIFGGLAMGLFISTIAESQEAAFFIGVFTTLLPTQLLSGFLIPIENMPTILQAVTTVVPAKYLLNILRAILLKEAPISTYISSFAALAIFAVLTSTVASLRLKKSF